MTTSPHLSSLSLDELALDALPAEQASQAREHLERCQRCRADFETAEKARQHFDAVVFPRTRQTIASRAPARSPRAWRRVPLLVLPALAAAALALFLLPKAGPPAEPALAVKGGALVRVVARRAGRIFAVADGATLAPGDEVRFLVESGGFPYLLVASVDGAGKQSIYFPFGGAQSGRLTAPQVELPGSVVLDAAPGPERIFALFSREPLSSSDVGAALRALGTRGASAIRSERTLAVPAPAQTSFLLEKAVR